MIDVRMSFRGIHCDRVRIHRNLFVAVLVHVVILIVKNIDQLIAVSADSSAANTHKSSSYGNHSLGDTVR